MLQVRPQASLATETTLIQQVTAGQFGGECSLPDDREVFSDHITAFQRVQQYAFADGFAITESQHCWVFSCVHHRKSGNKHNITDKVVRKEIFLEMGGKDEEGATLRQRKGYITPSNYYPSKTSARQKSWTDAGTDGPEGRCKKL
ncbi:hypothetical protein BDD12DRAFT_806168 [Trichophaea hybrida]|nr:hypothetical protein BDD12DRAFT_806168 [Trichophaea hybrida]